MQVLSVRKTHFDFSFGGCTLSIMRAVISHISASVVVGLLLFVSVNSMPSRLENAHFVAESAHHIQRRAPVDLNDPKKTADPTGSKNHTCANSTTCSTSAGITDKVTDFFHSKADIINRALIVLGSISAIVLVYISLRYFW